MLKSYLETVCWLATHEAAVLVIGEQIARVVDSHHHADGVHLRAARALLEPPRIFWFSGERNGARVLLRLNEVGEAYHRRLVERRRCSCQPRPTHQSSDRCPKCGGTEIKTWAALGCKPRAMCVACKHKWTLSVPAWSAQAGRKERAG